MNYGIFSIKGVSYPNPAAGWGEDGVYIPRRAVFGEAKAEVKDECVTFEARHFREKEETGWGVYDYAEAPEFEFAADMGDYEITALFMIPAGGGSISAFLDGIMFRDAGKVTEDGEHMSVTLRIASVGDTSAIRFFVIDEERLSAGLDTVRELKLCRLETCRLERGAVRKKPTLFIASDSTAQSYGPENYPQTGWGQMLHKYFRGADFAFEYVPKGSSYSLCRAYECPGVIIENRSIGGRSSRSFVLEGKWNELLFRCEAGDYIFIQFGHNDSTKARPNRYTSIDEFGEYIRMYVASAKARGAIPVLVTPVSRRSINEETGVFNISFPEHRNTVLKIARELDTPVIDLGLESRNICEGICETLGAEATKELFLWTYEGEYSGVYCRGSRDDTHLQRRGALIFAGAVAKLIEGSDDDRLDLLKAQLDPDMKYELYLPTGEERH